MDTRHLGALIDELNEIEIEENKKDFMQVAKSLSDESDIKKNKSDYIKYKDYLIDEDADLGAKQFKKKFKIINIDTDADVKIKDAVIDCAVMHVRGKVEFENCNLKCMRFKIHKGGKVKANNFSLVATSSLIVGRLINTTHINLVSEEVTISSKAKVKFNQMNLLAKTFTNAGRVQIKKSASFKLDYFINQSSIDVPEVSYFVNRNFLNLGSLNHTASTINAVTFLNFWRINSPKYLSINSALGLSYGILQSNNSMLNVLLRGPFIHLPALPDHFSDIFNWASIKNGLIQAAQGAFPALSSTISLANASYNLSYQFSELKKLKDVVSKLKSGEISLSEILPVLTQLFSFALSAKSVLTQGSKMLEQYDLNEVWALTDMSYEDALNSLSYSSLEKCADHVSQKVTSFAKANAAASLQTAHKLYNAPDQAVKSLAKESAIIFGPKIDSSSLVSVTAVEIAASIAEKNLVGVNPGAQAALNLVTHSEIKKHSYGVMAAMDLHQTGGVVVNHGLMAATAGSVNADQFENLGEVKAKGFAITTKNIKVKNIDTDGLTLDGHVENLDQIIFQDGQDPSVKVAESLTVRTDNQTIIIDKQLRDVSVDVTAAGISVSHAINKLHDVQLRTTEKELEVTCDVHARNVVLQSAGEFKNSHKITSDKTTVVNAKEDLLNTGEIRGTVTSVEGMNIINRSTAKGAAIVEGSQFLAAYAENDIQNLSHQTAYQGSHDTRYSNIRAEIKGGTGNDQGIGAVIHAKGEVHNFAATMTAQAKTVVIGEKGVTSAAAAYEFQSGYWDDGKFWHSTEYFDYDTEVFKSVISSTDDRVEIGSDGKVLALATDITSKTGATIRGKDVELKEVITNHRISTKKSGVCGTNINKGAFASQNSVPTRVVNSMPGVTIIRGENSVSALGAELLLPGKTFISAPKIDLSTQKKLQTSQTEKSGFQFNPFGVFTPQENPITNLEQGIGDLADSQTAEEVVMNATAAAVGAVDTVSKLDNPSMNATSSISHYKKIEKKSQETQGLGYLVTDDLEMEGSEINIHSMPVRVSNNARVKASKFTIEGEILDTIISQSMQKETFSHTLNGENSFEIQKQKTAVEISQVVNSSFTVGKKLEVEAEEFNIDQSNVTCQDHDIECARMNIKSGSDTFHLDSSSHSASTTGQVSKQKATEFQSDVSHPASFGTGSEINKDNFRVKELNMDGAVLHSDKTIDVEHVDVNATSIRMLQERKEKMTSANLFNLLDTTFQQSKTHNKTESSRISLIQSGGGSVRLGKVKGEVVRDAESAVRLLHTKQSKTTLKVPTNLKKFKERVIGLCDRLSSVSSDNKPSQIQTIQNVLQHDNAEQSMESVLLSHKLSQLVYQDDCGGAELAKSGVQLIKRYQDKSTGTDVAVYQKNDTYYVAFKGTKSFKTALTDDVDIMTQGKVRSVNADMLSFIHTLKQNENTKIILTGHSRGAAQASVVSSELSLPAVVFENPGVNKAYNVSKVVSVQSQPNLINQPNRFFADNNSVGYKVQLDQSTRDKIVNLAGDILSCFNNPVVNAAGLVLQTIDSHVMKDESCERLVASLFSQ